MAKHKQPCCNFRDCVDAGSHRLFDCNLCDYHVMEFLKLAAPLLKLLDNCPELLADLAAKANEETG